MEENVYASPNSDLTIDANNGKKLSLTQIYFSLEGRVNRKAYWLLLILPALIVGIVAAIIVFNFPDLAWIEPAFTILMIWPSIAVQVKRWHDRDKSGWWVLIGFIPIIGPIWALIENGFLSGDEGWNQYGDPQNF